MKALEIYCDYIFKYVERIAFYNGFQADSIDRLFYALGNVKGIDYSKDRGTYNPEKASETYFKISEKIEEEEKEYKFLRRYLDSIRDLFENIPDHQIQERIERKYHISEMTKKRK